MKNVLESGFKYESINKIIKTQYHAKMTTDQFLPDYIFWVNLIEIKHYINIYMFFSMNSYVKHNSKTFLTNKIYRDY